MDSSKSVVNRMRADIKAGRYGSDGARMPETADLCVEYGAPRAEVVRAIDQLRREGVVGSIGGGHRYVKDATSAERFVDRLRRQIGTGELAPGAAISREYGARHGVGVDELLKTVETLKGEHLLVSASGAHGHVAPARQIALAYADFALLPSPYGWLCKRASGGLPGGEYWLLGMTKQGRRPCVAPATPSGEPTGLWVPKTTSEGDRDLCRRGGCEKGAAFLIRSLLESKPDTTREPCSQDDMLTTPDEKSSTIEVALLEVGAELRAWWGLGTRHGLVSVAPMDGDIVLTPRRLDGSVLDSGSISVREKRVFDDPRFITVLAGGISEGVHQAFQLLIHKAVTRGALGRP